MDDSEGGGLEQIRAFLAGSGEVRFAGQRREEVYVGRSGRWCVKRAEGADSAVGIRLVAPVISARNDKIRNGSRAQGVRPWLSWIERLASNQ